MPPKITSLKPQYMSKMLAPKTANPNAPPTTTLAPDDLIVATADAAVLPDGFSPPVKVAFPLLPEGEADGWVAKLEPDTPADWTADGTTGFGAPFEMDA